MSEGDHGQSVVAVIPAYNEASTIGDVIDDVQKHVQEVVVVDDASSDETKTIARGHGATVLEHTINMGVGGAQRTGYRYAQRHGYDIVLQLDADGQHDPAHVPEFLDLIEDNDMVMGSRYLNESIKEYPLVRRTGIRFFTLLVNLIGGIAITDVTSGFRAYRVERLDEVIYQSDRHWAVEQTLMAARAEFDIEEISVEMPSRHEGESQFSLKTLLLYPFRMTDTIIRILIFR